jgi:hypothetical protein
MIREKSATVPFAREPVRREEWHINEKATRQLGGLLFKGE